MRTLLTCPFSPVLLILTICFAMPVSAGSGSSQDGYTYSRVKQNGIGLRFGPTSGIVYTRYIGADQGLDMILSFRQDGAQITGLYFRQQPLLSSYVTNLSWYGGGGGHVGWTKIYRHRSALVYPTSPPVPGQEESIIVIDRQGQASIGLDGLIGVGWHPDQVPVSVRVESKPYVDLFQRRRFASFHLDIGATFQYRF